MNTTDASTAHPTGSTSAQHLLRDKLTEPPPSSKRRALVLHGGGSAGNAWEIGVIAGLFDGGLDVTSSDLIIGTSAGATVAAQISGATEPSDLIANILLATPLPEPVGPGGGHRATSPSADYMEMSNAIIAAAENPSDMRRRMGAAALALDATSDGSGQLRWRRTVAARLSNQDWPDQRVLITAVNAQTGEPIVFDRHSGVELIDAVAASCANGFGVAPYKIGGNYYIDGGYRRNENADLAAGYGRVLVLSPFSGRTRHPLAWRMQLSAQIDELRNAGSEVETIFPDRNSLDSFGVNMMDPATRPPAARAGYDQGLAVVERITEFWR